jgi:hypothetical protein
MKKASKFFYNFGNHLLIHLPSYSLLEAKGYPIHG